MALSIENKILHLRYVLREAAEQFEFYQKQHAAKGTEDGNLKAQNNAAWAFKCRDAIRVSEE